LALQAFARVVELGDSRKQEIPAVVEDDRERPGAEPRKAPWGAIAPAHHATRHRHSGRAAFYERCVQILADLDEAEASVMQARVAPKGKLRVDMPGGSRGFHHSTTAGIPRPLSDLRLELGMGIGRWIC